MRLNDVEVENHSIFQELTRARQYFEKLKQAEERSKGPNLRLDRDAASRFIRNALVCHDWSSNLWSNL